ncbi:MAG: hypothetical protein H0U95_02045 [Bacteroidetes bacterium]|nr:hypothetical protein [Bacteroidota bacterium]
MFACRTIIAISFLLSACTDITQRFVEETIKEGNKRDSLKEQHDEFPISKERFEFLERKKLGNDSLFLVRTFFLNGKKYSDSWYKNDVRDSISKFYYNNGKPSHSFAYHDGVLTGLVESYLPDGTARNDSKLTNGNGNLKVYHPVTYKLYISGELKNGHRNGKFLTWYANGAEHEDFYFVNDSLVGNYTVKYKSGAVQSQRREGKGKITYSNFYINGKPEKLEVWENNKLNGSKSFDEDGNITEESWLVNGQIKSVKSFYGSKKLLLSRGNYLDQKKQGSYEYYYDNGAKKAIEFYDQDTLLSEKRWYENGILSLETKYAKGEYDGLYVEYYPNGKKRKEQMYANGVKQGKYTSYFDNGNKYNEGTFVDGKPKGKVKVYSREGKFIQNKEY